MSNIIEARVKQKKDTLANWEANPMILLDGEQAFVVNGSGQPINFKIGDGTKRFSDLPYWIQYDQAAFIPVSGLALPTPSQPVGYSILGEGTYTHASGGFTVPAGHWGVANWDGSAWSFSDMGLMPKIKTIDLPIKSSTDSFSSGGAYTALNGGDYVLDQKTLTGYTTTPTNTLRTYIFDYIIPYSGFLGKINYYATVAGDIYLRVYKRIGNSVTFKSTTKVSLVSGENVLDLTALKIPVEAGDVPGFAYDTTVALGRIGFSASASEANYYTVEGSGTGTFALPTKAVGGGFGLYFTFTGNNGILPNIDSLIKKTSISGLVPEWTPQVIGSNPNPTISKVDGYNQVTFTTNTNQAVYSFGALASGKKAWVRFKAKLISGSSPAKLVVGEFATVITPPKSNLIEVTATEKEYFLELLGIANNSISIGMRQVDNAGQVIAFKDFYITEDSKNLDVVSDRVSKLEEKSLVKMPDSFNVGNVLSHLSKYNQPLLVGEFVGDSLFANGTGGVIPNVEVVTRRPIRLGFSNTLARRFYDYMSWNKPTWLRLDDSAWVKTGTWTAINNTSIFEPIYSNETYHTAPAGIESTASVNVPAGNENFCFLVRKGTASGSVDVYLNDVLYTTVNTLKSNAGHTGNPFHLIKVFGMPSGQVNNVKIISKSSNTSPVYVWGGFFWTGNTMVIFNAGHGGHTLKQLSDNHINDEVVDNKPDFIFMELTLMNDVARVTDGSGNTIEASVSALNYIIDNQIKDIPTLYMSVHPWGTDPNNPSVNYAQMYPGFIEMLNSLKRVLFDKQKSYLGVTESFLPKIIGRGKTFDGGGGGDFTHDGQHQNPEGMMEFWGIIKQVLVNNPLKVN